MTSRDFCFWLQGMFELGKPVALTEEQTKMVKLHLELVFKHEIAPEADKKLPEPVSLAGPQWRPDFQCGVGGIMVC